MVMASSRHDGLAMLLSALVLAVLALPAAQADVKRHQFDIVMSNVSRLCHTKSMVTVNGSYPGPTIISTRAKGTGRVVVTVTNRVRHHNVTIHWHNLVEDGDGPDESVLPPPTDLPKC